MQMERRAGNRVEVLSLSSELIESRNQTACKGDEFLLFSSTFMKLYRLGHKLQEWRPFEQDKDRVFSLSSTSMNSGLRTNP